jgi:hypothetical protein
MTSLPVFAGQLKITPAHLELQAIIYVRQSSPKQVRQNQESQFNQRALVERAKVLGWHRDRIVVLDADLGQSAKAAEGRLDFKALAAEVALGHARRYHLRLGGLTPGTKQLRLVSLT